MQTQEAGGVTYFFLVRKYRVLIYGGCFLLGVALASLGASRQWLPVSIGAVCLGVFSILVGFTNSVVRFFGVVLLCLSLGALRFVSALETDGPGNIAWYAGHSLPVEGIVEREPDQRLSGTQYVVKVRRVAGVSRAIQGRLLLKLPRYPAYEYGDEVRITCSLARPKPAADGFRYDTYLAAQGISVLCEQPKQAHLIGYRGSWFLRKLFRFKHLIAEHINAIWPEPESSLMAGILYGSRAGLPPELTEAFNRTGVTHIIAVSGSNISYIAVSVMAALIWVGLNRRYAWVGVSVIIIGFVLFTGASASVVRAGIMGFLALLAKYFGRRVNIAVILVGTALCMALGNPYVLVYDAGFQLSFLSTLGLIYVAPLLSAWFPCPYPRSALNIIWEHGITTLAALGATLPLLLFQFGRLSIVAPLVNILVLWTIPYIMLIGFLATMASVWLPLGIAIGSVAALLMEYVIGIVTRISAWRFAALSASVPWWVMLLLYAGGIGYLVYHERIVWVKKQSRI